MINFLVFFIILPFKNMNKKKPMPRKPPWASLARSVPKPLPPEAISARQRPPPPANRKPKLPKAQAAGWSSLARYEVRLPKVNRRWRGTRYDSPKLIVVGEVPGTTLPS